MKKSLLIAVLILAVLTSLTAGTLAKYTKTVTESADFDAKKFFFSGSGTVVAGGDLHIAPGDTKEYAITLTQSSDVPMTYTVQSSPSGNASFLALLGANSLITYKIGAGAAQDVTAAVKSSGRFTFDTLPTDSTIVISYKTTWVGDDATDINYQGLAGRVNFEIRGDQRSA